MHIADGVLNGPVLAAGFALTVAGVAKGMKDIDYEDMPRAAMLSAAFFVASLVHVPVGPGQVHLLLNGLVGIILGWGAFPVLLIGLLLQAVLFGYGGITVLGINTLIMAAPAVLCFYMLRPILPRLQKERSFFLAAAFTACLANLMSSFLLAMSLYLTDREFVGVIAAILVAHLPVIAVEAPLVGTIVVFLKKMRPDLLGIK